MHNYNFSTDGLDSITVNNTCFHCGETNTITADKTAYMRWYTGEFLIQEAFPNLSTDERELIMTGTHPECWNRMFAQDVTE